MFELHLPGGRVLPVDIWPADGRLTVSDHDRVHFQLGGPDLVDALRRWSALLARRDDQEDAETAVRFSRITIEDIAAAPTPAERLALLIERFRHSLPDVAEALMDDYRSLTGRAYVPAAERAALPPGESTDDELARDLARLRPYLDDILKNGRANKSEIARRLGVSAGGSKWPHICRLAEMLEKQREAA